MSSQACVCLTICLLWHTLSRYLLLVCYSSSNKHSNMSCIPYCLSARHSQGMLCEAASLQCRFCRRQRYGARMQRRCLSAPQGRSWILRLSSSKPPLIQGMTKAKRKVVTPPFPPPPAAFLHGLRVKRTPPAFPLVAVIATGSELLFICSLRVMLGWKESKAWL